MLCVGVLILKYLVIFLAAFACIFPIVSMSYCSAYPQTVQGNLCT